MTEKADRERRARKSLRTLYEEHGGKVSDKWALYLDAYERFLAPYRDKPVRLLEIGIQNGGSLDIWAKYFPKAKAIVGCDINPDCRNLTFRSKKVKVIVGDANSDEAEHEILAQTPHFDIIIDDGSHKSSDIIRSFARYFGCLADGGIYIAEDLHCSYWQRFEGGLYDPYSSMSFFKRLLDVVNQEHWGIGRERADVLDAFAERYAVMFGDTRLDSIHSIEFMNSLCVIKKAIPSQNELGERLIAGKDALVVDAIVPFGGTRSAPHDESRNPWSLASITLEEEIEANRRRSEHQNVRMAALSHDLAEAESRIRMEVEAHKRAIAQIAMSSQEIKALNMELTGSRESEHRLRTAIAEIHRTMSWRVTKPMRALKRVLVGGRKGPGPSGTNAIGSSGANPLMEPPGVSKTGALASEEARRETVDAPAADPAFLALSGFSDEDSRDAEVSRDLTKLIAFYLPQYHRVPENSEWWGPGFTEWTNVARGKPNFVGHTQPNIPRELGFYDLTHTDTIREQAELAKIYGIHGFCFYHYWFSGRRILERPVDNFLKSDIDINFCLCWANENWTRTWDGDNESVLMEQRYAEGDAEAFIDSLIDSFRDDRYIRINGKPLLLVYRAKDIPNPKQWFEIWRERVRNQGFLGLHIAVVDFYDISTPDEVGADSLVEFPPHKFNGPQNHPNVFPDISNPNFAGGIIDYTKIIAQSAHRVVPPFKLFRGIMPAWDNTARRQDTPTIVVNARPDLYGAWLSYLRSYVRRESPGDPDRLIFINAWNEWGEGCYLEPDQNWGLSYLEQTLKSSFYDVASDAEQSQERARKHLFQRLAHIVAATRSSRNRGPATASSGDSPEVQEIAAELAAYRPPSGFARKASAKLIKWPALHRVAKLGYVTALRFRG